MAVLRGRQALKCDRGSRPEGIVFITDRLTNGRSDGLILLQSCDSAYKGKERKKGKENKERKKKKGEL